MPRRPYRSAAALAYARGDSAPRVTAAGRGPLAQRILDTAEAAGVVVVEDAALSALLETVEPGSLVPWECWEAVARILALIAREENI